ncbi:MAG: hypothetical protein AAGH60_04015 [Pseudomonadota bacterium]
MVAVIDQSASSSGTSVDRLRAFADDQRRLRRVGIRSHQMRAARPRAGARRSRTGERRAYLVIYALTIGLFVFVAFIARLIPRSLRARSGIPTEQRSVIAEAQSTARATLGYAFMG